MARWLSAAIPGGRRAAGSPAVCRSMANPSPFLDEEFGILRGTVQPVGAFRHVPGGLKPHYLPLEPMRVPVPVGSLAVARLRRQAEYKQEWCDAA